MNQTIKRKIFIAVAILGFTALFTQIVLLREFMVIYHGNELVIGLILANWMFLTGLGSFAGRYVKRAGNIETIILLQSLGGVLPYVTLFVLYYFRNQVYPVGMMLSLVDIFYTSFLLLLPFCFISGFLFTYVSNFISLKSGSNMISLVYGLEATGSIAGGFLFSFVLVYFLNSFQSLVIIMLVNLVYAFWLALSIRSVFSFLLPAAIIVSLLVIVMVEPGKIALEKLYPHQNILEQCDTPYGNVVVTQIGDQKNVYENGIALFSSDDVVVNEESVHYAMLQHNDPARVLLISGGVAGMIDEIMKYPAEKIDYLELNSRILDIGQKYIAEVGHEKVDVYSMDSRIFVKKTDSEYDVVLINLPDPSTVQINRYYSIDFFRQLKKVLSPGAVVSTSLSSSANYMSEETRLLNSVLYRTLDSVFNNVLVINGAREYYLASDKKLDHRIVYLAEERKIENEFVNGFYLDDERIKMRSDYFMKSLRSNVDVNKDSRPLAYLYQVRIWLSYFDLDPRVPLAFGVVIFLLIFLFQGPSNLGMFSAGMTGASVEFLLLVIFQTLYGYVYQQTGVIFMIFMGGMALGSLVLSKRFTGQIYKPFLRILYLMAALSLAVPAFTAGLKSVGNLTVVVHIVIYLLSFIFSVLAGIEFALASRIKRGRAGQVAGALYFIDLVGSAFGVLMISAFILPIFGLYNTFFLIGGINILCAAYIWARRQQMIL